MKITQKFVKDNKDKILEIQIKYQHKGVKSTIKDLAKLFDVADWSVHRWIHSGKINSTLSQMFSIVETIDTVEILDDTVLKPMKWYKRGRGSHKFTKDEILYARQNTMSAQAAARYLGISYNTFKKYSIEHGILDDIKNQSGIGISKGGYSINYTNRPDDVTIEAWEAKLRRKELRDKHLLRYHDNNGDIAYGCALYIITIPKGEERIAYINKWGNLPIKIGVSKDIVQRYSDMILDKTYVYSNEDRWTEWNELAEVINIIPFYTTEECLKVESRIHTYIRDYKISGIYNKEGGEVCELFETPFELLNEAIETYVTGWRISKWNDDEMNNENN
jgi:hypothetical protein